MADRKTRRSSHRPPLHQTGDRARYGRRAGGNRSHPVWFAALRTAVSVLAAVVCLFTVFSRTVEAAQWEETPELSPLAQETPTQEASAQDNSKKSGGPGGILAALLALGAALCYPVMKMRNGKKPVPVQETRKPPCSKEEALEILDLADAVNEILRDRR